MKRILIALMLTVALTGCGGSSDDNSKFDITNPIDSTIDMALDGLFTGPEDITLEFDGETAVIADFGNSVFGTNPMILPIGSALIEKISCNTSSCSGMVAVAQISNGFLTGINWEPTSLKKENNTIKLDSNSLGEQVFTPKSLLPTPSKPTLSYTARCDEWWNALTQVDTWRATWVKRNIQLWGIPTDMNGNDPFDLTFKFSGDSSYEFFRKAPWDTEYYTDISGDDVTMDNNFTNLGHCRIISGHTVLFPHSLSNGELILIEEHPSQTDENKYVADIIMRLKAE